MFLSVDDYILQSQEFMELQPTVLFVSENLQKVKLWLH